MERVDKMAHDNFFKADKRGRTTLFFAVEIGDIEAVKAIIFKLAGTGVSCQRLALINKWDLEGLTAIEVAEKSGNSEIVDLLRSEKMRMEFFE
jgi:ankyrin repeat protein